MHLGNLPPALAAFVLAAAMSIGAWAWLGRPVPLPDVAGGRLQCLSYAPSHGGAPSFDALVGNLLPVTIGNVIGGAVLVGLVYWFVYLRGPEVDAS